MVCAICEGSAYKIPHAAKILGCLIILRYFSEGQCTRGNKLGNSRLTAGHVLYLGWERDVAGVSKVRYVLSYLKDSSYKRTLAANRKD